MVHPVSVRAAPVMMVVMMPMRMRAIRRNVHERRAARDLELACSNHCFQRGSHSPHHGHALARLRCFERRDVAQNPARDRWYRVIARAFCQDEPHRSFPRN
eukprot:Amastigsp_a3830_27.p2 type:complete len:101 gc:universal Amastigsp_a3830_27:365-63(-)